LWYSSHKVDENQNRYLSAGKDIMVCSVVSGMAAQYPLDFEQFISNGTVHWNAFYYLSGKNGDCV
jgi:hypothetical protein